MFEEPDPPICQSCGDEINQSAVYSDEDGNCWHIDCAVDEGLIEEY